MGDSQESQDSGYLEEEDVSGLEGEQFSERELPSNTRWLSGWARLIVGVVVLAILVVLVGPQVIDQVRQGQPQESEDLVTEEVPKPDGHEGDVGTYAQALSIYGEGQYGEAWAALRLVPAYESAVKSFPGIAEAEKGVQENPSSSEAHFRLGTQWAQAQLYEPAEVAFLQALALDDQYVDAYSNLGVVYYQTNRLADAVAQYDKALQISPDDADIHHNRGAAYVQQSLQTPTVNQELLAKGIAEFEHAVALDPALGKAYFSLGIIYYQVLGDADAALPMFEKFLALDDGTEEQATMMAQQFLQELNP
jgi:tetratricopeptide (TPR) repeat protein